MHLAPEAIGAQPGGGQPSASVCDLDVPGNVELVATERHDAHGYARGERLLGDAHAAVADDAGRVLEDGTMRHEALDVSVGRRCEV